jgi:hypothetical protein
MDHDAVGWMALSALSSFAVSVGVSIYVLLLKPDVVFSVSGSRLLEAEDVDPRGLTEAKRRLVYWLEDFADGNHPTINRLFDLYRLAAVAVLVEVILWSVELSL